MGPQSTDPQRKAPPAGKGEEDSEAETPDMHTGEDPPQAKSHLIGDALKTVYRRTLDEDIPEDLVRLLDQLK